MRELTDSYCERCGTRYTFGPSPAKGPSLNNARLLARGLKNFVMTDGTSMDEAMAAARIDVTKDESLRVTEEFHRTFNFCMTCRQYACDKCWNENQGACLSCAPLWDEEPVAPRDHLLIRTPVTRQDLDAGSGLRPVAEVEMRETDASDPVPWPAADPLYGRPAPRPRVAGNRPAEKTPIPSVEQDAPVSQTPPIPQTPLRTLAEAAAKQQPVKPAPVSRPQAQPRVEEPRPLTRVSENERSAAQQLHAQSQAWKSADDGWTLWPLDGQPAGAEMTLTPEEIQLIEAQLSHTPARDEPDASPIQAAAPDSETFTTSHTLAEDAARVIEPEPGFRTEPERPVPGAWEPETPAPRNAPSADFDLLGSLRQPIELSETPVGPEPRRAPVIGRLLGQRAPADDTAQRAAPKEPKGPRPVKAPRSKDAAPTALWPAPTPWVERPLERHDWWGDADSAPIAEQPPVDAVAAQMPEPFAAAPEFESPIAAASAPIVYATPEPEPEPQPGVTTEPVPAAEKAPEPSPAEPAQQPLFKLPAATTDRWAAAKPDLPPRVPVDWPAGDPLDYKWAPPRTTGKRRPVEPAPLATPPTDETSPWPTVGASWLSEPRSTAPWAIPLDTHVPASVVAASQADMSESPLVAALWAESAQQVFDRGSVRVCHHCALPVSTQARYCRRCGTHQG